MNCRRVSGALALMMILLTVISGTLLVLHAEHDCHEAKCPTCMVLARTVENLLSLTALAGSAWLFMIAVSSGNAAPPEDRLMPVWTPVRRKVKLLN